MLRIPAARTCPISNQSTCPQSTWRCFKTLHLVGSSNRSLSVEAQTGTFLRRSKFKSIYPTLSLNNLLKCDIAFVFWSSRSRSRFCSNLVTNYKRRISTTTIGCTTWKMTSISLQGTERQGSSKRGEDLLAKYGEFLRAFQEDEEADYRVVERVNSSAELEDGGAENDLGDLVVLDSSFNPPTKAHLNILLSSLLPSKDRKRSQHVNILLLLAIKNADKAALPASFDHRIAMMRLFAEEIKHRLSDLHDPPSTINIDIGLIKHARFLDKATTLQKAYPSLLGEIIFLTGFDTLIRILDPKYYGGTLHAMAPFFDSGRNRIKCNYRPPNAGIPTSSSSEEPWWRREQDEYLRRIREGEREVGEGCMRRWAERIEFVDGIDLPISSTEVRTAVRGGDDEVLRRMLPGEVKEWVIAQGLYRD